MLTFWNWWPKPRYTNILSFKKQATQQIIGARKQICRHACIHLLAWDKSWDGTKWRSSTPYIKLRWFFKDKNHVDIYANTQTLKISHHGLIDAYTVWVFNKLDTKIWQNFYGFGLLWHSRQNPHALCDFLVPLALQRLWFKLSALSH